MNKPKLIICDIDNTLVPRHKNIMPRAKNIIDALRKHGIAFGTASGRPLYQINECYERWGCNKIDVTIGFNGGVLWDAAKQEEHVFHIMKKEWLHEIIELMSCFDTNPSIYLNNNQLFLKEDDHMKQYQTAVRIVKDISEFYQTDNAKIMFRVDEKIMSDVERWINIHPSDYYAGFKTQSSLVEFCDKRVNKAYALDIYCKLHSISPCDVIAFGDTTNDNEMLKYAGLGVCMLNGSDDTKEIADMITEKECDEDGWADFMEHYILSMIQ